MTNSLYIENSLKNWKLRAVEPEPPKQEEVDPLAAAAEAGPPNAKNNAASNANSAKKDPTPPAPYRYCMPTHAVYTPPKPTARKPLTVFFHLSFWFLFCSEHFGFCFLHNNIDFNLLFRLLIFMSLHSSSIWWELISITIEQLDSC